MAGRRVKLQSLNNSLLSQNLDDYGDLNLVGTLAGTISTASITGTFAGTLSGTYATDVAPIALALKELQAKVNSILSNLT
jgi:hypothetical protein